MPVNRSWLAAIALAFLFVSASSWAGEPIWIDVRSPGEFESGHVEGSINIPHTEIVDRIGEVTGDKDATLYLYCRSGNRSGKAMRALQEAGFTDVSNIGGYQEAQETFEHVSEVAPDGSH